MDPWPYCIHTNFWETYISWMPQFEHSRDFIFEDHWPDFANDYANRNEL